MSGPFFSVLVTAYNRAAQLERCLSSCTAQTWTEFEIVVVDDASTDDTIEVLSAISDPRLRIVRHDRNRGISPARATAVEHARGQWLVMLDSDWELLPESLARLAAVAAELPPGVRMIRSRLRWDDGSVTPPIAPEGVVDYRGRLEWLEAVTVAGTSSDAGHCIHRDVFRHTNFPRDRRGGIESLWETSLARTEPSMWIPDVLGLEHTDAVNSVTRDARPAQLVPRLIAEAPDVRWMAETMLAEHGEQLRRYAPHYRRWLLETAAQEAFLCGDRRAGLRYSRRVLRVGPANRRIWASLGLGLLAPRALARAKAAARGR
jgi:glycosyltransferase involved in cell wall biosynthesis